MFEANVRTTPTVVEPDETEPMAAEIIHIGSPGACEPMTKFDRPYNWCSKLNGWNLNHVMGAHLAGLGCRGEPDSPAHFPAAGPSVPAPEVAGMVAGEFSLVRYEGYMSSPTTEGDWHDTSEDDVNSIPISFPQANS